jgi:hypothetical protein
MPRDVMTDIAFGQVILFQRSHKRRDRKESMAMANKKQFGRYDHADRRQLPTCLLKDSGDVQIEIRNDRPTNFKRFFPA